MTDFDDDDALASEYVIGTLDAAERTAVDVRLRTDRSFGRLVDAWTNRLAPLLDTIPPLQPDAAIREAVLVKIGMGAEAPANDNVAGLQGQLRLWRIATGVSVAAAVLLALWGTALQRQAPGTQTYMAVLQQGGNAPAFLVSLDLANHRMTVMPSSATPEPDKSLQLWMVADANDPHSLGLIDAAQPMRTTLPDMPADMISKATYAVTLEPKGGSPKPTTTPIYIGHLIPEPG